MRPQSSDVGGCILSFCYLVLACLAVYVVTMVVIALIQAAH